MRLKKLFFVPFAFFLLLWGLGNSSRGEVDKIDAQITELEQEKMGYEARALKHDYMAEYLQFNNQAYLETRRHIQLADENRAKAALIQARIDELKAKRARLAK